MDDEEKKSLPEMQAGTYKTGQTDFRLHYFPDIPVNSPLDADRCDPLEENFQRVRFDTLERACGVGAAGFEDADPVGSPSALSNAGIDNEAYRQAFAAGKKQGLLEGQNLGFQEGLEKIEPVVSSLQEALTQLKALRAETCRLLEEEVVELALAIAEKIICREIKTDPKVVLDIAREALRQVDDADKIRIKMNPCDLSFINETKYPLNGAERKALISAEDQLNRGETIKWPFGK